MREIVPDPGPARLADRGSNWCSISWEASLVAAGGMGGTRSRLSMSERVALTSGRPADGGRCPARHCWVSHPVDGSVQPHPGLLVEWRQVAEGGWQGRVVYLARLRPGRWSLVEEWVDEALLGPA